MDNLKNKVAFITGAGRGLGKAITNTLHSSGSIVIVADIRKPLVEEVVSEINKDGGIAFPLTIDITNEAEITSGVSQVIENFGKIDILINNAGIDITLPIEEVSTSDWERVIHVNLLAPFMLSKAVIPIMKKQGEGHILNITSTAAKRVWANASAYHASKWGLLGFSHALHVEGRPHNIKVTAVIAGGMKTPFLLERFPDIDTSTLQDPKNVAETIRFILLQPPESVIPEVMIIPMKETSWP